MAGTNTPTETFHWEDAPWSYRATISAPKLFGVVDAVATLVDEARFTIDEESIRVLTADPANVAIVEVEADCVSSADGRVDVKIPVNMASQNWPPYYKSDDDPKHTLNITRKEDSATALLGSEGGVICEMDVTGPDESDPIGEMPEPDFGHEVTLPATKAIGTLSGMARVGNHSRNTKVRFTPDGDTLILETIDEEGNSTNEWSVNAPGVGTGAPQIYSSDYLADIADVLWPHGEYTFRFAEEQPLEIATDGLRYMLAPRLET